MNEGNEIEVMFTRRQTPKAQIQNNKFHAAESSFIS
jgi:hypothetical protein